jgi:hypothetical protein
MCYRVFSAFCRQPVGGPWADGYPDIVRCYLLMFLIAFLWENWDVVPLTMKDTTDLEGRAASLPGGRPYRFYCACSSVYRYVHYQAVCLFCFYL